MPKNQDDQDFVESMGEMIVYFMQIKGNSSNDSKALAEAVKNQITQQYQGERIFIKRGKQQKQKDRRNSIIKKEFNGQNAKALMQRFRISRSTLYRIVSAKKIGVIDE